MICSILIDWYTCQCKYTFCGYYYDNIHHAHFDRLNICYTGKTRIFLFQILMRLSLLFLICWLQVKLLLINLNLRCWWLELPMELSLKFLAEPGKMAKKLKLKEWDADYDANKKKMRRRIWFIFLVECLNYNTSFLQIIANPFWLFFRELMLQGKIEQFVTWWEH